MKLAKKVLTVDINNETGNFVFSNSKIANIAQKITKFDKKIKGGIEINIVGDEKIKYLNKIYRGKNKITDVLSFAWQEEKTIKSDLLGQIYICRPQIERQAKEYKISAKNEFIRMLAHGILHLAGHDHQNKKDAGKMFALQDKILDMI